MYNKYSQTHSDFAHIWLTAQSESLRHPGSGTVNGKMVINISLSVYLYI